MRLDQYITEKLQISKNKAQNLIKTGNIKVNLKTVLKPGFFVNYADKIDISKAEELNYVARSALKLKGFLAENFLDLENKICLDVGASTGGFCQILLEKNIGKIFAVDVGTSQLHSILKENKKIISIENTDIRKLQKIENIDFITCDVSFINLEKILESIIFQMSGKTKVLLLFKPQFQVGKGFIDKKGVVKDKNIIEKKLGEFLKFCGEKGLQILKVENSKLAGENGNQEIFILLQKRV
ncbi:TlyA family RNA methyltransferase [Candidatus Gracilibacteria bacterium]|nr:MAG: TlyA family RNA methyltransferase [Candidatus Gracilibacteria bacterium]